MIDQSKENPEPDARTMALYGLITGLVMAAERRGIASELLREAVEIADSQTLKFQSVLQFAAQGEQVLNEIEELRQFFTSATVWPTRGQENEQVRR